MLILFVLGILAGVVEASAGGSGLISLPTVLYLGYQPIEAVATSKFQYAFGALTAIGRFTSAGLVSWRKLLPMLIGAVAAGAAGALFLSYIGTETVAIVMPIFLVMSAIYFYLVREFPTRPRIHVSAIERLG